MNNISEDKEVNIEDIKHPKKRLFLENYHRLINTKQTAVAIGVNESTVYRWIEGDKLFSQAFQVLKKRIDTHRLEEIEAEIYKRAIGGESKQSDILLMFEAKALDPGKYREKPASIPITGDIIVRHLIPRPQLKEGSQEEGKDAVQG